MSVQVIRIIDISNSFSENTRNNYKMFNIDDAINALQIDINSFLNSQIINSLVSRFEIIGRDCIPYFDIEKIPEDKGDEYINEIAKSLMNELSTHSQKQFTRFCITYNTSSITHPGKSYHVYFPEYSTIKDEMKKFVNYYIDSKKEGYEYIDASVYSKDRLFRLPYQKGVNKSYDVVNLGDRYKDFHRIIVGTNQASDYIISNTATKERVFFSSIPNKYLLMKSVNIISGPYNKTDKKLNKVCDLLTSLLAEKEQTIKEEPKSVKQEEDPNEQLYNRTLAIRELLISYKLRNRYYSKVNELITYYENNKTFDGFRLPIKSIVMMLDIIEAKI